MSFFLATCPGCGRQYWCGVVGMEYIGDAHECPDALETQGTEGSTPEAEGEPE